MRRNAQKLVTGSAAVGLVVSCLVWQPLTASAEPACLTGSSDFDHDGTADVAVGAPGGAGRDGAVQVRLSNKGEPFTTTLRGGPGFGSAVTSLSSDGVVGGDNLCSQLVVGSPDESLGTDEPRSGVVHVYYFDATSKQFAPRVTFLPQGQGVEGKTQSGARFGAALAAEQRPASDPRPNRLYVGAPGFDVEQVEFGNVVRDAGRVTSFWIDDDEDPLAHDTQTIDYGDDFTPGRASTGAALGSSLSVGGGLVAAGAPGHAPGSGASGGAVLIAPSDPRPDDFLPEELSQATRGVPGSPEKGDRFGASVHLVPDSAGAPTLLVGAPGEDLGRTVDAGTVTIAQISPTSGEPVGTVRFVDQDSAGMDGTAEADDQFGSAVSSMQHSSQPALLIGTPGEDVGKVRDAGMVQTVGDGRGWTQNTARVPGGSDTGDRMGASLSSSAATKRPIIGVPGENASTGAVIVGLPVDGSSVVYLNGITKGNRFGFAVAP